jgi:hypothetical protein
MAVNMEVIVGLGRLRVWLPRALGSAAGVRAVRLVAALAMHLKVRAPQEKSPPRRIEEVIGPTMDRE